MRIWLACVLLLVPCARSWGDIVTFDLGSRVDGSAIDGVVSGMLTRDGLTAIFTANDGIMNATSTYFGINAAASGDDTDQMDAGSGVNEFITITFDAAVEFRQLSLASFTDGEVASIAVGLNAAVFRDGSGPNVLDFTADSFPLGNTISLGQTLVIGYTGPAASNGFSLEGFQVNTVPEPSILGASWLLAGLSLLRRRRTLAA